MKTIRLATNFLRDQRWPLVGVLAYSVAMALAFGVATGSPGRADAEFYLRQQAAFAVFIGVAVAGSALSTDLRSRRLLAILSKAVHRAEYVGGIILACWTVSLVYVLVTAVACASVPGFRAFLPEFLRMFPAVLVLALLAITVAVMFSIFVHPFFATALTAIVLIAPAPVAMAIPGLGGWIAPAYELGRSIATGAWTNAFAAIAGGSVQSLAFFAMGVTIFQRKDIAASAD